MRPRQSLLFIVLVSFCAACHWEAFIDDGETYFGGVVIYQDTGEAVRDASVLIIGEQANGFSNPITVSSDTIPVNSEGFFEVIILDYPRTDSYTILVLVRDSIVEPKTANCNDNVNSCAILDPGEEHSVIIQI